MGSFIELNDIGIVQWINDSENHKCGYCKSPKGSISDGMWAETLTVEDYQNLIDRGWRRSGKYCYKPVMDRICCPQYTIKCNALNLSLTKSQKKILKKMNKFLGDGLVEKNEGKVHVSLEGDSEGPVQEHMYVREGPKLPIDRSKIISNDSKASTSNCDGTMQSKESIKQTDSEIKLPETQGQGSLSFNSRNLKQKLGIKGGIGADPNKPWCKKAKLMRLEKKQKKLEAKGLELKKDPSNNKSKCLEDFISELPQNCKHKLKLTLVSTSTASEEWTRSEHVEFQLYEKYQQCVHDDKNCSPSGFKRFLVDSPLIAKPFPTNTNTGLGYGSYHQQYWLDDKLIAVGVIDILPKCVSSVYFFYDPDYRNLTLGTYGMLRELEFTRKLSESVPNITYYYLGFYIHSCPKMLYKGRLSPSYLLCPESYNWVPIEKCLPKLDASKYARLVDDSSAPDLDSCTDPQDLDKMKLLIDYQLVPASRLKTVYPEAYMNIVNKIACLVGKSCVESLLFVIDMD